MSRQRDLRRCQTRESPPTCVLRQELKRLLDDDEDMADMYLARAQALPASRLNSGSGKGLETAVATPPPSSGAHAMPCQATAVRYTAVASLPPDQLQRQGPGDCSGHPPAQPNCARKPSQAKPSQATKIRRRRRCQPPA